MMEAGSAMRCAISMALPLCNEAIGCLGGWDYHESCRLGGVDRYGIEGKQATATAEADPYGMTTKGQATATTEADPYGMTNKGQATANGDCNCNCNCESRQQCARLIRLVFELDGAGLLTEAGLKEAGDGPAVVWTVGSVGRGGVEAVEDEEVALGVVHGGEGGDTAEMIEGGQGVHFIVVDLVPGDVPAGLVGADADGEVHGAEVVADAGEAGHEREIGAADGEDEGVVGAVSGDDVVDLGGGASEGVLGGADVVDGVAGVG